MREPVGEVKRGSNSGVKTVMLSETEGPKEEKPGKQLRTQKSRKKPREVFHVDPKPWLVSDCPLKRAVFSLCEVKLSVLVGGVS